MHIRINITSPQAPASPPLWWVPHDRARFSYDGEEWGGWRFNPSLNGKARESARIANASQPEVYRLRPEHNFRITEPWQDLLCALNPALSREKTLSLLGRGLGFCNGTWGVFDQVRVMGGALVSGTPIDGKLWIRTLRVDREVPPVASVLTDPALWFWCTGVQPDADVNLWWRRGLDGQMHTVRMFLVSAQPVYIDLDELLLLPPGLIPSPQWLPARQVI